jgi:hypothetical protein
VSIALGDGRRIERKVPGRAHQVRIAGYRAGSGAKVEVSAVSATAGAGTPADRVVASARKTKPLAL